MMGFFRTFGGGSEGGLRRRRGRMPGRIARFSRRSRARRKGGPEGVREGVRVGPSLLLLEGESGRMDAPLGVREGDRKY